MHFYIKSVGHLVILKKIEVQFFLLTTKINKLNLLNSLSILLNFIFIQIFYLLVNLADHKKISPLHNVFASLSSPEPIFHTQASGWKVKQSLWLPCTNVDFMHTFIEEKSMDATLPLITYLFWLILWTTYLWYWACRKLNSSFILSIDSTMFNLNGWLDWVLGGPGTCKNVSFKY